MDFVALARILKAPRATALREASNGQIEIGTGLRLPGRSVPENDQR
jgi:hypothetical protein